MPHDSRSRLPDNLAVGGTRLRPEWLGADRSVRFCLHPDAMSALPSAGM
jgi:hypothetical protein